MVFQTFLQIVDPNAKEIQHPMLLKNLTMININDVIHIPKHLLSVFAACMHCTDCDI